jgi:predicted transcriptional regulator
MADSTIVTLRLPKSLVERADALIEQLREDDQMVVVGRVSRSIVLRLAVLKGLNELEEQTAAGGKKAAKR